MLRFESESSLRLGFFDIDGTIRGKEGIPQAIVDGFDHLHEVGIETSIMTGRGYTRFVEALGEHKDHLISPTASIGLENGGRITDQLGTTIKRFPLTDEEIDATFLTLGENMPEFLLYYPADAREKARMWYHEQLLTPEILRQFSSSADISTGELLAIREDMRQEQAAMVVIKPQKQKPLILPQGLNSVAYEGVITVNTTDISKASGVKEAVALKGIPLYDVFVAGNDENDRKMLNLPVGIRILVGDELCGNLSFELPILEVKSPEELGEMLKTFS